MHRAPVPRLLLAGTMTLSVLLAVVLGAVPGGPAGVRTARAAVAAPPAGTVGGTAPVLFGLGDPNDTARHETEAALGMTAGIVGSFATQTNSPDFWVTWARDVRASGAVLQLFWDPTPNRPYDPMSTLRAVLRGDHDAYIRHWTRQVAEYGHPVIVRLWAEMNGSWQPYSPGVNGNTASEFAPAWRHVVALARAEGADNILWTWNPDKPFSGSTPLSALWPGSDVVDWVGLDVYNWGDAAHGGWNRFSTVMGPAVAAVRAVAGSKPLMLNEVGCGATGGDKAAWLTEMFASLPGFGVRAVVYFDYALDGADWRLRSPPAAMDAARQAVRSGAFVGGTPGRPDLAEALLDRPRSAAPHTVADFDGDGRTDRALFTADGGRWAIAGQPDVAWGTRGDVPVAADYRGSGSTSAAVYRPGTATWWLRGIGTVRWGEQRDAPVPADYTGDGRADVAIWRPSTGTWWIRGVRTVRWGEPGDVPVPADYNGDGRAEPAVYRPSTGTWWVLGSSPAHWGVAGDVPVSGDYDRDGRTDLAIWRPSTGVWWLRGIGTPRLGRAGEVPAPGDYDADGGTDPAMYDPATHAWTVQGGGTTTFGSGGRPVALPAAVLNAYRL